MLRARDGNVSPPLWSRVKYCCCLPVHSKLVNIERIAGPNRTKFDIAHPRGLKSTHDKCGANKIIRRVLEICEPHADRDSLLCGYIK